MTGGGDRGWRPSRGVTLVAGTPPGGGQDRPARALIDVIAAHGLLDRPVNLVNIPGRGGGNAWDHLRQHLGDAHLLAINSPTVISNRLLGVSPHDWEGLTPLVNLYTEYPVFIVRVDSALSDVAALVRRLKTDTAGLRIALATAKGNTNHIALARLAEHAGGDVKALSIDVFDSARYAIAHVVEGKAELGVITAVSAVPELTAGVLRTLTLSGPARLGRVFADVPTLRESGVDCDIGMWRGVIAPRDLPAGAAEFWTGVLVTATKTDTWRATLDEKYWADTFLAGADVHAFLDRERDLMTRALGGLGLMPAGQGV